MLVAAVVLIGQTERDVVLELGRDGQRVAEDLRDFSVNDLRSQDIIQGNRIYNRYTKEPNFMYKNSV